MTTRGEREAETLERGGSTHPVSADAERDLVECGLADEVPTGILREVRRAALARHRAATRLQQAGCDLGERRLSAAVPTLERNDLAPPDDERRAAENLRPVAVGDVDVVEANDRVAKRPGRCGIA